MAKERQHQQMVAQMKRIDRALDDCSRPISLLISKIQNALSCYVGETITDIERIDPGIVMQMTELIKGSIRVDRDGNGTTATSTRSNRVLWDASSSQAAGILRAEANHTATFDSAAAAAIATFYSAIMMSQPYAREIPGAVTSYLDHDPISPAAARLRLFIRHGFVPDLRAVAALLRTHAAATMELPPTAWLKSKFPAESWASIPSTVFFCYWMIRAEQWDAILAQWDAGVFEDLMPKLAGFPVGGLWAVTYWAIGRGEEQQRRLTGMTTEVEQPSEEKMNYGQTALALAGASE